MEVNDQVVSQGIVLAGILAGFAFAIAAEIALREPIPEGLESSAFGFLFTGLFGVVTAVSGVLYFGKLQDSVGQVRLGFIFLWGLGLTGLLFLFTLFSMFRRRFVGRNERHFLVLMVFFLVDVAALFWLAYL